MKSLEKIWSNSLYQIPHTGNTTILVLELKVVCFIGEPIVTGNIFSAFNIIDINDF